MAIPDKIKLQFELTVKAFVTDKAIVVECERKVGGTAYVICGSQLISDNRMVLIPLAEMVDGDRYITPTNISKDSAPEIGGSRFDPFDPKEN